MFFAIIHDSETINSSYLYNKNVFSYFCPSVPVNLRKGCNDFDEIWYADTLDTGEERFIDIPITRTKQHAEAISK